MKKSRPDEIDASLSAETSASSAVVGDESVKCSYCQSSTNRLGDAEDLLVCKDCHASSQYS